MLNSIKIKKRLSELGITQKDAAFKMNISRPSFNQKINNERKLTVDQLKQLSNILKISKDEYDDYFYS